MFIDIWPEVSERARRAAEERANKAEAELAALRPEVVKLRDWLEQACGVIQAHLDGGLGKELLAWYEARIAAAVVAKKQAEAQEAARREARRAELRNELDALEEQRATIGKELAALVG